MKIVFIYELIDPITDETRYIGKTNNIIGRFSGHLNDNSFTYKANWIKSLKKRNLKPILNIIDEVNNEEAGYWEMFYISLYRSWNCRLTNGTRGGEGGSTNKGKKFSEEWIKNLKLGKSKEYKELKRKRKIKSLIERLIKPEIRKKAAETHRKNYPFWISEETKEKISKAHKGKIISEEHKKKISQKLKGRTSPNKGNILSLESKKQMSESHKGKTLSKEIKEKISKANKKTWELRERASKRKGVSNSKLFKTILQFDKKENFIKEWKGIKITSKILNISENGIIDCCKGKQKTCGGFIWKYKLTV